MMTYTVTFLENGQAVLIQTFHANSIGEAFDAALRWHESLSSDDDIEAPAQCDYDSIQIQPAWVIWREKERSAA